MAKRAYPSSNDVGGTGVVITEARERQLVAAAMGGRSGVLSGFALAATSGLAFTVSAGVAIVDGQLVELDQTTLAGVDNNTRRIFLRVDEDAAGDATDVALEVSSEQDPPASNFIRIGAVECINGAVNELREERDVVPGTRSGSYTGNGSGSINVLIGRTPTMLIVAKDTSPHIFAFSNLSIPGDRQVPGLDTRFPRVSFSSAARPRIGRSDVTLQWTSGAVSASSTATQVETVLGALVGAPIMITNDELSVDSDHFVTAEVTATDEITLTATNLAGVGSFTPTGDFEFVLPIAQDDAAGTFSFQAAGNAAFAPLIIENGFTVSTDAQTPNLNQSGVRYDWLAIF